MRDARTVISLLTMSSRSLPFLSATLALWVALACSHPARTDNGADWSTEVIPHDASALPVGANVTVELDQPIGLSGSRPATQFTMHVTQPVIALDRSIVIPAGAVVFGHVAAIAASRGSATPATVRLGFDSLRFGGHRSEFSAVVVRTALPSDNGAVPPTPQGETIPLPPLGRVVRDSATATSFSTFISLGMAADATLPQGTRMTLRSTRRIGL